LQDLLAEFVPEFDKAAFIFVAVLLVLLLAVPGFDFGDELITIVRAGFWDDLAPERKRS